MKKLINIKTLRNKVDSLLTPLVTKIHPRCLLCGMESKVAHHFIKKSESNRLRYELDNLIPLCHKCHFALHNHESIYSGKIIDIKGLDWFKKLIKLKQEFCKVDRTYYQSNYSKLINYCEK